MEKTMKRSRIPRNVFSAASVCSLALWLQGTSYAKDCPAPAPHPGDSVPEVYMNVKCSGSNGSTKINVDIKGYESTYSVSIEEQSGDAPSADPSIFVTQGNIDWEKGGELSLSDDQERIVIKEFQDQKAVGVLTLSGKEFPLTCNLSWL
jgi:hypothetical protein